MGRFDTLSMIGALPRRNGPRLLTELSCLLDLVSVWRDAPLMAVAFLAAGAVLLFRAVASGAPGGQAAFSSEEVEDVRSCERCHS
jgi:hypothetical protein